MLDHLEAIERERACPLAGAGATKSRKNNKPTLLDHRGLKNIGAKRKSFQCGARTAVLRKKEKTSPQMTQQPTVRKRGRQPDWSQRGNSNKRVKFQRASIPALPSETNAAKSQRSRQSEANGSIANVGADAQTVQLRRSPRRLRPPLDYHQSNKPRQVGGKRIKQEYHEGESSSPRSRWKASSKHKAIVNKQNAISQPLFPTVIASGSKNKKRKHRSRQPRERGLTNIVDNSCRSIAHN